MILHERNKGEFDRLGLPAQDLNACGLRFVREVLYQKDIKTQIITSRRSRYGA